jgi:hypothetical protein
MLERTISLMPHDRGTLAAQNSLLNGGVEALGYDALADGRLVFHVRASELLKSHAILGRAGFVIVPSLRLLPRHRSRIARLA